MTDSARILVVDNYDSFVYTIVGYLKTLGATVTVVRNDAIDPSEDGVIASLRTTVTVAPNVFKYPTIVYTNES